MKVFVVYCHPSTKSFTHVMKEEFLQGLKDAGHSVVVSDLYQMNFNETLSEDEYLREAYYRSDIRVSSDVLEEQRKIQESDAIVFIYPVFWTEAPSKLVGWFDRVWSSGFAYAPNPTMKTLDKALFLVSAGKSQSTLAQTGELNAMRTVMLGDRIRDRAKQKEMIVFDGMSHWDENHRQANMQNSLKTIYQMGKEF